MRNEFYELKPGETVRNVLMYNSPTVLLNDLDKKVNFVSGSNLEFSVYTSHYGKSDLENAQLCVQVFGDGKVIEKKITTISKVANGQVSKLESFSFILPVIQNPIQMKLSATLEGNEIFAENEWELYLFPKAEEVDPDSLVITEETDIDNLCNLLEKGKTFFFLAKHHLTLLPPLFAFRLLEDVPVILQLL